jgi:hypothetical protein
MLAVRVQKPPPVLLGFCAALSVCLSVTGASEKAGRKKTVDKKNKCDVANVGLAPVLHADVPVLCTKNLITQKPDKATGSLA